MKKINLAILVLGLLTFKAMARDSSNGCGLGWEVTDKNSFSASSTRTTTNAIIPNTFGMTSGTMGCAQHSLVKADKAPVHFAEANFEVLMAQMAVGEGEALSNFASTMGCDHSFNSNVQKNYGSIATQSNTGVELVQNVSSLCHTL